MEYGRSCIFEYLKFEFKIFEFCTVLYSVAAAFTIIIITALTILKDGEGGSLQWKWRIIEVMIVGKHAADVSFLLASFRRDCSVVV